MTRRVGSAFERLLKDAQARLTLLGFTGVDVGDPQNFIRRIRETFHHGEIQVLDADTIAGRRHVTFAAANALRAFEEGSNVSRSIGMETLLIASAQRQIAVALNMVGISTNTRNVIVVAFDLPQRLRARVGEARAKVMGGRSDNNILDESSPRKVRKLQKLFGVTNVELKAAPLEGQKAAQRLEALIIERMAISASER